MNIHSELDEKAMHAAVSNRDVAFDGRFIYAVITTGIYCQPSCASRTAKPENMRFFDNTGAAGDAGYRACKRCKPDQMENDNNKIVELGRYIEQHADEALPLAVLAKRLNLSPTYLQKSFKSVFGVSPKAYQDAARLNLLKGKLKAGEPIVDAVFESGYGSSSRAYDKASSTIGMTPKAYKNGACTEQISFTCRTTSLGPLMIAATSRGVCFAMFGESQSQLHDQLSEEFPKADIQPTAAANDSELDTWISAIEQHLQNGAPMQDIPLDMQGTAFQIRVWQFLLSIPAGKVVSYSDVANSIKQPTAVRATATACGKNKIALLIPCHRVLRGDGGLGGFRWGVERKRAILDSEALLVGDNNETA